MKKIIVGLVLLSIFFCGCTKKYYPQTLPAPPVTLDGYISGTDRVPKLVPVKADWTSIVVYVYGNNDKLIAIPATVYQGKTAIYATYQIDTVTNTVELYFTGMLYKIVVQY